MNQDGFRKLLTGSRQPQYNGKLRVHTSVNGDSKKTATIPSSEPAFKPRKIKKSDGKYRDRAAERRDGTINDYAQVEAVLEDFERRAAHEDRDVIEEQRRYLGGDSQHTILVKGLDMSLLEQNRARAAAFGEDDEILEQAFVEATSAFEPMKLKKRTREDIIRDLKANRQTEDKLVDQSAVVEKPTEEDRSALEVAKGAKFRPIGFKPIGEEKPKKRKVKEGKEGTKKRRKAENVAVRPKMATEIVKRTDVSQEHDTAEPSSSKTPQKSPELEPAALDENFDIFADAEEYQPFLDYEGSEEEHHDAEETKSEPVTQDAVARDPAVGMKGWFDDCEHEAKDAIHGPEKSPPVPETIATEEVPQETRLKPLESSTLPSIRDFLAMDDAAEKAERRKARKEKKNKKNKSGEDDDDD